MDAINMVSDAAPIDSAAPERGGDTVAFTPAKRRGRPPKNAPGETPSTVEGGPAPAKRGRPAKKKEITPEARGILAKQIAGIHLLGAGMLGLPELQLTEVEATTLAESVVAVCDEYGLSMSGKTGAAVQLLAACAMIYAPRYFAVQKRVRETVAAQQAQEANRVVEPGMPPNNG